MAVPGWTTKSLTILFLHVVLSSSREQQSTYNYIFCPANIATLIFQEKIRLRGVYLAGWNYKFLISFSILWPGDPALPTSRLRSDRDNLWSVDWWQVRVLQSYNGGEWWHKNWENNKNKSHIRWRLMGCGSVNNISGGRKYLRYRVIIKKRVLKEQMYL